MEHYYQWPDGGMSRIDQGKVWSFKEKSWKRLDDLPSPEPASEDKALRYNKGKAPLSYVTSARYALEGAAEVFAFGAEKYDRDNWKKGLEANAIIDSLLRHICKYQEGETHDDESGCHHLDHVLCNAIFLAYHHNGKKEETECK